MLSFDAQSHDLLLIKLRDMFKGTRVSGDEGGLREKVAVLSEIMLLAEELSIGNDTSFVEFLIR